MHSYAFIRCFAVDDVNDRPTRTAMIQITKLEESGIRGIRKLSDLPVFSTYVPDHKSLNRRLRKKMLALAETVPDVVTNTANGTPQFDNKWLSATNLFKDPEPSIQAVVSSAEQVANKIATAVGKPDTLAVFSMWCIVGRLGLTGHPHRHKGTLSGVYYVDAGKQGKDSGGNIQFFAPRGPKDQPTHAVVPASGLVLMFPSKLMHSVSAYSSSEPRIVISFNLK